MVDTFPRWSERFIARELSELLRRGVDFDIFCLKAGRLPTAQDSDWDGLIARRIVLPSICSARTMASALADMPNLRAKLYKKVPVEISRELGLVDLLKLARAHALEEALIRGGYDHVHAHFAGLTSSVAWLASKAARLPLSISVHARDLFVEPQLLAQKLADSARVFTCHEYARKHLSEKMLGQAQEQGQSQADLQKKIVLMRHGVPLEQFPYAPAQALNQKGKTVHLLAAGRFVPKKGFEDLIEAMQQPALAGRKIVLTLLGEGPGFKALRARIDRPNKRRIVFREPEGGQELRRIFEHASLFVAPYRAASDGDVDGVPNVVLEAFALGLPVIGTSAGGLGEVLREDTGTVVPSNNPVALADAIAAYLDSAKSALAKTRAARKLVERDYNIRKNIGPLIEMLGK